MLGAAANDSPGMPTRRGAGPSYPDPSHAPISLPSLSHPLPESSAGLLPSSATPNAPGAALASGVDVAAAAALVCTVTTFGDEGHDGAGVSAGVGAGARGSFTESSSEGLSPAPVVVDGLAVPC